MRHQPNLAGGKKMSDEDRVFKRGRGEATAQGFLRIFTALCKRKRSCVHLLRRLPCGGGWMPRVTLYWGSGAAAAPPPPPHGDAQTAPSLPPAPSLDRHKFTVPLAGPSPFRGAEQGLPSPPAPRLPCCNELPAEASAPAPAVVKVKPHIRTQSHFPRPMGCK